MRRFLLLLVVIVLPIGLFAQQSPSKGKKPVLIRDDPAEKAKEVFKLDPQRAKESVNVGDFYFKRDNYKAAEQRYRDAIKYNPKLVPAYEKLVRSLEKQKEFSEAIAVCDQFATANPSSKSISRFQEWARDFKTKAAN